jgi:hypothetical protein
VAVFGADAFRKLQSQPKVGTAKIVFEVKDLEVHTAADLRLVLGV